MSSETVDGVAVGAPRAWTEAEEARLNELWMSGRDSAEISRDLGRPVAAISMKAHRLGLPPRRLLRRTIETGRHRACLCCRRQFLSSGAGHRICDPCKASPEWQGAGASFSVLGGMR